MKIHITNLYNFNRDDQLVQRQHKFADAGRSLGFYEMGIFSFPVETDTEGELSKRLDGVIAALEPEDVVIMQLPTRNGIKYEQLFFNKIKAYRDTKVALLFHKLDMLANKNNNTYSDYMSLCKRADVVILPSGATMNQLVNEDIENLMSCEDVYISEEVVSVSAKNNESIANDEGYLSLCNSNFYVQKLLMDVVWKVHESQMGLSNMALVENKDEIQIGFGLHDKTGNYSVWVGVVMQSIIENTNSKICFHILIDDTVTELNKEKLTAVATKAGHRIFFYLLEKKEFEHLTAQVSYFTIGTMFRIMLPELLPNVSKIIYLDADILVNRDIYELWQKDINQYCIAAVIDKGVATGKAKPIPIIRNEVLPNEYFNAGVLYINLDKVRYNGNMRERVLTYLENTKDSQLPDQDALNVIYKNEVLFLEDSWNYFVKYAREMENKELENKIYHYAGTSCILYSMSPVDILCYEIVSRTPWKTFCHNLLQSSLERVNDRICQMENIIFHISGSSKKYIFYGEETNAMRNMYDFLGVREDDYRVLAAPITREGDILPCKDLSMLYEEKNEYVVLVLPQADGGTSISRLEQMGLINGKDYFVIPRILPPNKGGYL